ncbi:MAG: hypothetical protein P0Y53_13285 [Candidatus Pseudobacter hemicellulosilyticus]|uniref:Uncharacterized protein n=1 Tax=Candidatus Pseudobacter hemicellulosilyticus TaxID=3121375 RepID=A0AAJ5WN46_9BACT|nr:MAG: hypothetical protein P0Y53_13285 [Pseudobacter sp.]
MKSIFHHIYSIALVLLAGILPARLHAQKIDSIYFHLYTDSLKKGVHNYINVDAKLADGRWQPLTGKELRFTSTAGKFEGNNLVIDSGFKGRKVTVKAVLKNDTALWREMTIYMKTIEVEERLPTVDEVMKTKEETPRRRRRG